MGNAVDAPALEWITGGAVPWFPQTETTHDGVDAAQAAVLIEHDRSWIEATVSGAGQINFFWKCSTVWPNYDRLAFYIADELFGSIPGDADWQQASFAVPDGTHTLRWVFEVDSEPYLSYAAWLDQVQFTPLAPPPPLKMPTNRGQVVAWGSGSWDVTNVPPDLGLVAAVSAGMYHSMALKPDGTVVAWGGDGTDYQEAGDVPPGLSNVVAISAGAALSIALKEDGTVVAWGVNGYTNVPSGLNDAIAISAGGYHGLALRRNGQVVGWGQSGSGQISPPDDLTNAVAIAAGGHDSLALRADGTVVGFGNNGSGETVPPVGLSGVIAIAAGQDFSLALKSNGTVVAWGRGNSGQTNVPPGLSGVVAISAGDSFALALNNNGTIVAWGRRSSGETNLPPGLTNVLAVDAGTSHGLALVPTDQRFLVRTGAVWKYLDTGTDLGTAWRAPTFNDAAWPSGPAQLGYGDGDEATMVNGGPANNHYITTYFRRHFSIANASLVNSLVLRLMRDDGAVVYLNGIEAYRANMPGGTVTYTTLASTTVGGADETSFFSTSLSPALLVNGDNVIAVELHQANVTSSDASFDLELVATLSALPPPVITTPPLASDTVIANSGIMLFVNAVSLGPVSYQWQKDGVNLPGQTMATLNLPNLQPSNAGHYRVTVSNAGGSVTSSECALTVLSASTGPACAGSLDPSFNASGAQWPPLWPPWGPTPITSVTVRPDSSVIISGGFNEVQGVPAAGVARLQATGVIDAGYTSNPADVVSHTRVTQPDGKLLEIFLAEGATLNTLVRRHADSSLDASFVPALPEGFNPKALALQPDGRILVAGGIYRLDPVTYHQTITQPVVRLLSDGSLDTTLAADVTVGLMPDEPTAGATVAVYDMVQQADGRIYLGGFFTAINGVRRTDVARLNADGSLDPSFVPDLQIHTYWDADSVETVSALALGLDGKLVIAGFLDLINGQHRWAVARLHTSPDGCGGIIAVEVNEYFTWETSGTVSVTFVRSANTNSPATASYACGTADAFGQYSISATPGDDFVMTTGEVTFATGETRKTVTIPIVNDNNIEASENFFVNLLGFSNAVTLNDRASTSVTIWDDDSVGLPGTLVASFPPAGLDGPVTRLAMESSGTFLAAGTFTHAAGQARTGLARFTVDGELVAAFNPILDGPIYDMAVEPGGGILIAGNFSTANGVARYALARLNPDGSLDSSFNASLVGGAVAHLALCANGQVMIAGAFTNVAGTPRHTLVRLEPNGSLDPTFDIGTGVWQGGSRTAIMTLATLPDGRTLIGGWFNGLNGSPCSQVARLLANGTLDTSFNRSQLFGWVQDLRLNVRPDGKILVGGHYYRLGMLGGALALSRLNADGTQDSTFPMFDGISSVIAVQPDGKILLDGDRRLLAEGAWDLDYFMGASGVELVLLPNGDILVGGAFTSINRFPVSYLVRLRGSDSRSFGPGQITLASPTWGESQGAPSVTLQVQRQYGAAGAVDVTFATSDGTATHGLDYVTTTGTLHFADGNLAPKTITIPLLQNPALDGNVTFQIALGNPTGGAQLGANPAASITLVDTNTVVRLTPSVVSVNESNTTVAFSVLRTSATEGPVSVQYFTRSGTATAGSDFVAASGTLQMGVSRYGMNWFQIQIINDQLIEGPESFTVYLTNATGGAVLRASSMATVTIVDDDGPPLISQQPASRTVPAGSTAAFNVAAAGAPPLSCQWQFNSVNIPGATGPTLPLFSVQPGLAGEYRVLVSNGMGSVLSTPATLTVQSTPSPAGVIVGWGYNMFGSLDIPSNLNQVVAIAASDDYGLALKTDGTVVAWGNYGDADGGNAPVAVPEELTGVSAIAAGRYHSLVLRTNGTVVGLGEGDWYGARYVPEDLSGVIAIACGYEHSVALKSDGTVVAWGLNWLGQTNVPPTLSNVVAIAAGGWHSLAVRADGTVVAWGQGVNGQCAVPEWLNNVIAVAAGEAHSLALRADGTVVGWGYSSGGQIAIPFGLSNIVAIAGGGSHSVLAKADGTVVALGMGWASQTNVPPSLSNVVAVAAGSWHSLALVRQDSPLTLAKAVNANQLEWTTGGAVPWWPQRDISHDGSDAAQATVQVWLEQSWIATTLTGPARISFFWKCSTYWPDYDREAFYIDGTLIGSIPGDTDWELASFLVPPGEHELKWVFEVESEPTAGHYYAWLDEVTVDTSVVITPPSIVRQPASQTVPLGGDAIFTVQANGTSPLRYQWRFNGYDLEGETGSQLVLTNVQPGRAGQYSVAIDNGTEPATSEPATLTLIPAQTAWAWARQGGGGYVNGGGSVAVDHDGNLFVTGSFSEEGHFGPFVLPNNWVTRFFLAKYDAAGNILWARTTTGAPYSASSGSFVAVDAAGNAYAAGFFADAMGDSSRARIAFGAHSITNVGWFEDVFLAKYDPSGEALWARRMGGPRQEFPYDLAVDAAGNAWITGGFGQARYDSNGNLAWAQNVPGLTGLRLALDPTGNAYLSGRCAAPVTLDGATVGPRIFLVKYSPASDVLWTRTGGPNELGSCQALACDAAGNLLLAGVFQGSTDFTDYSVTASDTNALFLTKFNVFGNALWAREVASAPASLSALDLFFDGAGQLYFAAGFDGVVFFGDQWLSSRGSDGVFLAQFDATGERHWATKLPAGANTGSRAFAADAAGRIFNTGNFAATVAFGPNPLTCPAVNAMYLARLDGNLAAVPALAVRELPALCQPGVALTVRLGITPDENSIAWAVVEQAPGGWTVNNISDAGVFDAELGVIKFGPFPDPAPRVLRYDATPPLHARGPQCFFGTVSADGINTAIGGNVSVEATPFLHPADNAPANSTLTATEASAYSAAWRQGQTWPTPPHPIPIAYVTRAAVLAENAGCYEAEAAQAPPLCWVPCAAGLLRAKTALPPSAATSALPALFVPGEPLPVALAITPAPNVPGFAVEDTVPSGWTATAISDGGELDATRRKVKWGPFLGAAPRTLTYRAIPPAAASGDFVFAGCASFDGANVPIAGQRHTASSCRLAGQGRFQTNQFHLSLTTPLGAILQVQSSTNLADWLPLALLTNLTGSVEFNDPAPPAQPQRFYRVLLLQ